MYCKNCGAKINEGDMFCGNCGQPIMMENNNQPEEVQQPVVENKQEPTEPAPQQMPPQPEPQPVQQPILQQQPQPQQHSQPQSQTTSGIQQKSDTNTEYKSSKSNFDSQKIIITIVLGIVFFVIGFECCKYYIVHKAGKYLDDYYYYDNYDYNNYDYDDYNYNDSDYSETNSSSKNNSNNSLSYTECSITSDDGTTVTLKLPSTLKISTYSGDVDYKTIKKVDEDSELTVTVSIDDETLDEAIAEVRKEYADEEYKNVKMSDVKTMNVGGRTYSYIDVEYYLNSMEFKYTSKYLVCSIDNNNLYGVILEDYEDLTDKELTDLLTITVTKQ